MSRARRRVLFVMSGLIATCVGLAAVQADDEAGKSLDGVPISDAASIAHLEDVLNEPTEMEFIDTPLHDVFEYLRQKHAIEIQLDCQVLADAGVAIDHPVTFHAKNLSLRGALHTMLRTMPSPLAYVIRDEVLLITTQDAANTLLEVRVYPVADFIDPSKAAEERAHDFDALKDVIRTTLPNSWSEFGGAANIKESPSAMALVVYQTQEGHRQINDLLRTLREVRAAQTGQ
ncbi:MAG TPA: hypothetical protein VG713_08350 [Pirellulales bacterium]|nr:hypothetical protein [Pirellulales bacterium]